MFLSCVLHVSHVAMGVKLLLKIKASEMSDLGFHCSAAQGGLHSRTVAAGSGATGKLWAPWLYAGFQEGHWRLSSDTLAWHAGMTNPLEMRKKGCLQPASLLNESENETLGVLLETFLCYLFAAAVLISIYIVGISVFKPGAVLYKWSFSHFSVWPQECSFLLFFFPWKRLLSGATCDWCKWLPLYFNVLGWTLLSPMFFIWVALSPPIILMETGVPGPILANNNQEVLEVLGLGLENVCW